MKRAVLLFLVLGLAITGLVSCGSSSSSNSSSSNKPKRTKLSQRVLASQDVSGNNASAGVYLLNSTADTIAKELSGGNNPTFMAVSPNLAQVLAFDSSLNSPAVQLIDTTTETNTGSVSLPGPATSMAVPTTTTGFAAVPTAPMVGFPPGALEMITLGTKTMVPIGVPSAQTVLAVPSSGGSQLLVFSKDSNSISVISPQNAVPPVEQGCDIPNPAVCTTVPGFDKPVYAVFSGTTAYILNCGAECGGVQASIQPLDLGTLTPGTPVPVNGATYGMIIGTSLYVAGNGTPTGQPCASLKSAPKTAAIYCGTLDIVDLNTMTDPYYNNPNAEIAITDGYHNQMSMGLGNQLFVGGHNCTEIGSANNPVGEVRGCLAIVNFANPASPAVLIPADSGDVTGLQNFTTYYKEYVAQGGNLRVYDTQTDRLLVNDTLTSGTILIVGYVYDVKAIDFF